ncbi:MAG TPA: hypothetical protein VGM90_39900 [Kofleriaceae bacterium]
MADALVSDKSFVALQGVDNGYNGFIKNGSRIYWLWYYQDGGAGGENIQLRTLYDCSALLDLAPCSTMDMQQGSFCFECVPKAGTKQTCNSSD